MNGVIMPAHVGAPDTVNIDRKDTIGILKA